MSLSTTMDSTVSLKLEQRLIRTIRTIFLEVRIRINFPQGADVEKSGCIQGEVLILVLKFTYHYIFFTFKLDSLTVGSKQEGVG